MARRGTSKASKARKPTRAEKSARIREVQGQILDGTPDPEIWDYLCSEHGLCVRSAQRYTREAWASLKVEIEADRDKLLASHLAMRRTVFLRAMRENTLKVAVMVLKDEAQLLGLYPTDRHTIIKGEQMEGAAGDTGLDGADDIRLAIGQLQAKGGVDVVLDGEADA